MMTRCHGHDDDFEDCAPDECDSRASSQHQNLRAQACRLLFQPDFALQLHGFSTFFTADFCRH